MYVNKKIDLSYQALFADLLETLLDNDDNIDVVELNLCKSIYEMTGSKVVGMFHKSELKGITLKECHPNRRSNMLENDLVEVFFNVFEKKLKIKYYDKNEISEVYGINEIMVANNIENFIVVPLSDRNELLGILVAINLSLTDNIESLLKIMEMISKVLGIMLRNGYIRAEKEKMHNELADNEAKLKSILNNIQDIFYITDEKANMKYISHMSERIIGYKPDELIGKNIIDFVHESDVSCFIEHLRYIYEHGEPKNKASNDAFEVRLLSKDGSYRWISGKSSRARLQGEDVLIGMVRDITDKKKTEIKLYEQATFDSMTNIYNRRSGLEILRAKILAAQNNNEFLSIIFIDINDLKHVNDSYGHEEGDNYIIKTCEIIKSNLRSTDIICRMGGDEFVLIFEKTNYNEAQIIANKIVKSMEEYRVNKLSKKYYFSISFGCATQDPDIPEKVDALIRSADTEMYEYKKQYKLKRGTVTNFV